MKRSVWIGFDPRWASAFAVARSSVERWGLPVSGIVLDRVRAAGLYWRPTWKNTTETGGDQLWDEISEAPMATEFSISRFLTPILARSGWALFMDCDMFVDSDLKALFEVVEKDFADKAMVCVKHRFAPPRGVKMDGQLQTVYERKNWSSFMLFNCEHPANQVLTLTMINELPGRDLHRLCWLEDDLIGELPPEWNWLAGHSDPDLTPANIHWTDGIPLIKGYEDAPYADKFRGALYDWAEGQRAPV